MSLHPLPIGDLTGLAAARLNRILALGSLTKDPGVWEGIPPTPADRMDEQEVGAEAVGDHPLVVEATVRNTIQFVTARQLTAFRAEAVNMIASSCVRTAPAPAHDARSRVRRRLLDIRFK